jgi:thioredoxin reductase
MTRDRNSPPNGYDVIVLGAGAAGLMCAAVAGQRGRYSWRSPVSWPLAQGYFEYFVSVTNIPQCE